MRALGLLLLAMLLLLLVAASIPQEQLSVFKRCVVVFMHGL
jgi:hypothetical protein